MTPSYFSNLCTGLPMCFRLNYTRFLFIFASLVFFYCLHFGEYRRLLSAVINSSADNRTKYSIYELFEQLIFSKFRYYYTQYIYILYTIHIYRMSQTQQKIHCQSSSFFNSTCSAAADGRGPHQNVIGYSIYGGNFSESTFFDLYLKSFRDTLRTVPIKYPGIIRADILTI
jgi:hypothetical protein